LVETVIGDVLGELVAVVGSDASSLGLDIDFLVEFGAPLSVGTVIGDVLGVLVAVVGSDASSLGLDIDFLVVCFEVELSFTEDVTSLFEIELLIGVLVTELKFSETTVPGPNIDFLVACCKAEKDKVAEFGLLLLFETELLVGVLTFEVER